MERNRLFTDIRLVLLHKLVKRSFFAPATSAESEPLVSTIDWKFCPRAFLTNVQNLI